MNQKTMTIRGLSFRWQEDAALLFSAIDSDFAPGSVSALMGANGVGKTTFLEAISGRLAPTSGKVALGERPAQPEDFNYLPQDSTRLLFSHLTLQENIALLRHPSGENLPSPMAALFSGAGVLSRYPAQCSGGQRQRAAVCRAILDMPHFPVTILDESLSALSRDAKTLLGSYLTEVAHACGAVVILVTHDVFDAMRFGDRVLALSGDRLSVFDTRDVKSEADCWRFADRREEILHSLRSAENNPE